MEQWAERHGGLPASGSRVILAAPGSELTVRFTATHRDVTDPAQQNRKVLLPTANYGFQSHTGAPPRTWNVRKV